MLLRRPEPLFHQPFGELLGGCLPRLGSLEELSENVAEARYLWRRSHQPVGQFGERRPRWGRRGEDRGEERLRRRARPRPRQNRCPPLARERAPGGGSL